MPASFEAARLPQGEQRSPAANAQLRVVDHVQRALAGGEPVVDVVAFVKQALERLIVEGNAGRARRLNLALFARLLLGGHCRQGD